MEQERLPRFSGSFALPGTIISDGCTGDLGAFLIIIDWRIWGSRSPGSASQPYILLASRQARATPHVGTGRVS